MFVEDTVLGEVVMEVTTIHKVQDEAQFVRGMESVCHTYNERAVHLYKQNTLLQAILYTWYKFNFWTKLFYNTDFYNETVTIATLSLSSFISWW